MSERKRKLPDPGYEDFAVSLPKQPHLSDEEVLKNTEDIVCGIIRKHFAAEEKFREEQLFELQATLSRAQETLADYRRAVVQNAYSRDEVLTSSHAQNNWRYQPSGNQGRIHPAVKKLIGWSKKPPSPIVPDAIGLPMTRRTVASLTATSMSEAVPSTSKDNPTPVCDVPSQDPSTLRSVERPSTSKADDSSQPQTSNLKESSSITTPSCSRSNSPSIKPTKTGVGVTKSLSAPEGSKPKVPRHIPPSEARGSAKPCRQTRMIGRVMKNLVVGNTSRCLSLESRPGKTSHKWMLYVRFRDNQSPGNLVHHVVFTLHPSYAPNDVVRVDQPPFHLYRRGWGEFLARVVIHFHHPQDKPVEVTHHLKLDQSRSGLERLGSETHVKVWLHETLSSGYLAMGKVEMESDDEESGTETEPAAPDGDSKTIQHESSTHLEDEGMEVDSKRSLSTVAIDDEPLSESLVVKEEPLSPSAQLIEDNKEIVIKEEPMDVPSSTMGLDIFYDDPDSFAEEVVEDIIVEDDIKEEPEEIDWPAAKRIKIESETPCMEKSLEATVAEATPTSVDSAVLSDPSDSSMSNVPSGSVLKTSLAPPSLVPNSSLPNDGNVIIKLLQPSGQIVYMKMCQASNSLTPIGVPGQVIRTSGQVIRTTGQVIPTPGQIIRTTGQPVLLNRNPGQVLLTRGVRPANASVVVNSKQIAANGHVGMRMVVVARPRLNGAPVTTAARNAQRSLLKPRNREESLHQELPGDPLVRITNQQSLAFPGTVEREPSIFGPPKRETSSRAGGSITSQPMGLTAAAIQHRNTINRTLALCSTERCPSVERMLGMLASVLPLVDARATKPAFRCVHPYTAPTLATFFEWSHGKRCAAERQRAVALRRLLLTTNRPLSDIWPTRHIQRWLLLHGYTPVQADPAHQQPAKPLRNSYSEPALALAWLDQLTEKEDEESDVDIMTEDDRPKGKQAREIKVEPDFGHLETLPMSVEMDRRSVQLAETTRQIGIKLHPEVIAGEMLYHAATRVMLEAVQLFTEEMLRRSLCKAWERNHNRPPNSLEPRDIRAAIAQYFPLISNQGLGQNLPTNQGS